MGPQHIRHNAMARDAAQDSSTMPEPEGMPEMSNTQRRYSRVCGSVVGVCVADALGGPVQFQSRGSFPPVDDFRYIEHFGQPAGSWSDDGSLTLCLAQSLIDHFPDFSAHDCARKFTRWYTHGYNSTTTYAWDVGQATAIALGTFERGFEKEEAGEEGWRFEALRDKVANMKLLNTETSMGNGSLMRCAPVGLVFYGDHEKAARVAREQSALTHPQPQCGDACEVYTRLLCAVMEGASKADLAKSLSHMLIPDETLRSRLHRHQNLTHWQNLPHEDIRSSGWVVDTLEAALWAFFTTDDWTSGALRAVNLGEDSDSVGAVYGGLAGAFYGFDAIPEKWRAGIVRSEMVHVIAEKLVGCSG